MGTPSELASSIPLPAWQQAVVVVLFIVFLALVFMFVRWVFTFQGKQSSEWRKFMEDKDESWKAFLRKQDEAWQRWMDAQNQSMCDSMGEVTTALKELSHKLDAHDSKVDERINKAVASVTAPARKRG